MRPPAVSCKWVSRREIKDSLCAPEKREPIELVLATADVLSEGAEGAGGERELFKFSLTTLSF